MTQTTRRVVYRLDILKTVTGCSDGGVPDRKSELMNGEGISENHHGVYSNIEDSWPLTVTFGIMTINALLPLVYGASIREYRIWEGK